MANDVSTAGRCDALADATLADRCRQTFAACEAYADADVSNFCAAQVESCAVQAAQGTDAYTLQTFDGRTLSTGDASTCFRLAQRASAIAKPGVNPKDAVAPQDAPPSVASTDEHAVCLKAGDEESPGNTRCLELVDQCLDGARELVTRGVAIGAANLTACTKLAMRIAISEFGAPPTKAQASPAASAVESWTSDGKTTFSRKLAETKLIKGFAEGHGTIELDLHIPCDGNAYHLPIAITYTTAKAGDGRVRLTYAIADDRGATLSAEQTIEFLTAGNSFADTLAFGITLAETGNFAKVSSVKIVKLP